MPAAAQFGPGSGGGSFSNPFTGSGGNNNNGGGSSNGDGIDAFLGFDVAAASRRRVVHGILAAAAFVVVFPLGAVFLRVLPCGRLGFWAHALAQMIGWVLYIAAAVLGILLVREIRIPGSQGGSFLVSLYSGSPFVLSTHCLSFVLEAVDLGAWTMLLLSA